MVRESKNYIADNLIELVDDLTAWDAYPWGEYFWRASYRRLVNVISRHKDAVKLKNKKNVFRTKKTKKIDSSKKIETYNVYGFVWSLKPWLIRSMDYFRTLLVDGQPNGPITASPEGIQPIICDAVVHDPQFEQQPKEVVESVPLFTSEELVAKYHSITTTVQLIEKVGDGDPSIVLKEIAVVKQRMNAIERFIKSRNDNLSEDSVAKQSDEKEIESSDGKADSAISNVLIGEISCQNLVQEQLQSLVETSKNKALSEEFDPKEYDKNIDDSGVGKTEEEEIHLDGLETVDDPFVQTPDKQNSKLHKKSLGKVLYGTHRCYMNVEFSGNDGFHQGGIVIES
ncbi:hypothetical protein Tco_0079387 [Tanacetum coccineum]